MPFSLSLVDHLFWGESDHHTMITKASRGAVCEEGIQALCPQAGSASSGPSEAFRWPLITWLQHMTHETPWAITILLSCSMKWNASHSVGSDSARPHGLCSPWNSPGQDTGVGRVAFPFSRGSSQTRDRTQISCIAGGFFTGWATGEDDWVTELNWSCSIIHHPKKLQNDVWVFLRQ